MAKAFSSGRVSPNAFLIYVAMGSALSPATPLNPGAAPGANFLPPAAPPATPPLPALPRPPAVPPVPPAADNTLNDVVDTVTSVTGAVSHILAML